MCMNVHIYIYIQVHVIYICVCIYPHLFIHVCPSAYLRTCLPVCLSIYLSAHVSNVEPWLCVWLVPVLFRKGFSYLVGCLVISLYYDCSVIQVQD